MKALRLQTLGFLERTQWVKANQGLIAVDLNADGRIAAGELVFAGEEGALNSLGWLDANGDGLLNARDRAFLAVRLWLDVNQDGVSSEAEVWSAERAGIAGIDFRSSPPSLVLKVASAEQKSRVAHVLGLAPDAAASIDFG